MKKNLLLIIILNSFFILSFSSNIFAKKAAIVIDFDTEEVLFEVNADTRNYPASLTKIMTLYIVFDYIKKGNLQRIYVGSQTTNQFTCRSRKL